MILIIKNIYDNLFELLKNKKTVGHTTNIIEWMIAYNLIKNNVNIRKYTIYEIDNMKQKEIDDLSKLLTMNSNNIENIKNILSFYINLMIMNFGKIS